MGEKELKAGWGKNETRGFALESEEGKRGEDPKSRAHYILALDEIQSHTYYIIAYILQF